MSPPQAILIGMIRAYRWCSPLKSIVFGPFGACRFHPTCSAYALEAVRRYGAARGGWLAVKRLARCHPWGGSGHDPVPPAARESSRAARRASRSGLGDHSGGREKRAVRA